METEQDVLLLLSNVWNSFLKLTPQHPDEIEEFRHSLHQCQYIVGMRYARKSNPHVFPIIETLSKGDIHEK